MMFTAYLRACAIAMAVCGLAPHPCVAADAPVPNLAIAYTFEGDAFQERSLTMFVESMRKARIASIQAIPARKFGDADDSVTAAVREGKVDLALVPFDSLERNDPTYRIFTTPFLFEDFRHLKAVQKGSIGQRMLGALRSTGLQGVGWWAGEFMTMAGDRPVVDPRDFASSLVAFQSRTLEGRSKVSAVPELSRMLGANAIALPLTPPQATLRYDGANLIEATPQQLIKLERVPKFVTLTNHLNVGYVIVANISRWEKFPPILRERLVKAFDLAYDVNTAQLQQRQVDLIKGGPGNAAVVPLSAFDREQWRERTRDFERSARIGGLLEQVRDAPVLQLVSTPAPPAKISWNAWLEDTSGKDVQTLTVGRVTNINLDLGRLPYKRILTAPPDPAIVQALASKESLRLLVQPIVLGPLIEAAPATTLRARTTTVSLKNATTQATDQDKRQAHWDGRLSTRQLSSVMGLGDILQWSVKATREGCANVAFAVWDEARVEPLDYIVVSLPVRSLGGPEVHCYGKQDSQDMAAGLGTLLREPRKDGVKADAALHVFEFEDSGAEHTVAVLVHARRLAAAMNDPTAKDSGVYSWELQSSLAWYMGDKGPLTGLIADAHRRVNKAEAYPYEGVVSDMSTVLFAGKTDEDDSRAQLAKRAFVEAVDSGSPARVFMRLVDKSSQAVFLPIGLLAAKVSKPFVSKRFTVIQSLPSSDASSASCIRSWHVARSSQLEGAEGDAVTLLAGAPAQLPSPGELLTTHQAVLGYLASQPVAREGEGFIMLAHHEAGSLRFTDKDRPPPRISSESVTRLFPASSMGVLAACSTSGSGPTSAIVNRLASQGMSTLILSPFPVDIEYGVRLALAFEKRAMQETLAPSGAVAALLFEKSAADVAASIPGNSALQDMALEFQLAGNPDLTVCRTPRN